MSSKPFGPPSTRTQVVLSGLLGALLVAPYRYQMHSGLNDEAVVLQAARRMLSGEVPYRDFDMFYTPGSMALTSVWLFFTGVGIDQARWLMVLWGGLLTALVFVISNRVLPRPFCFAPPVFFALSGYSEWPVISYHWFAIGGLLASLEFCLRWFEDGKVRWLMLSGLACGFAGACLQSEGVATFLSLCCVVLIGREKESWSLKGRQAAWFVGGVLALWIPVLLILLATGAFQGFVDNTILRVLSGLYHSHAAPYSLDKYLFSSIEFVWSQWPSEWTGPRLAWAFGTLAGLLTSTLKYGLFFPVILVSALVGYREGGKSRILAIYLVLWVLVKRERLDLLYSNYFMPLWYVALGVCLVALWKRYKGAAKVVSAGLVALYLCNAYLAVGYTSSFVYPVPTPGGLLWSRNAAEAQAYGHLYRVASELTRPGTKTFAWPFACSFYVLSDTVNPSRLDFLVPGWQDNSQVEPIAATLESQNVEYLYMFTLDPGLLKDYPNIDPDAFQRGLDEQRAILTQDYEPFAQAGPAQVFRRKRP